MRRKVARDEVIVEDPKGSVVDSRSLPREGNGVDGTVALLAVPLNHISQRGDEDGDVYDLLESDELGRGIG